MGFGIASKTEIKTEIKIGNRIKSERKKRKK